jgi:hypothetical protein
MAAEDSHSVCTVHALLKTEKALFHGPSDIREASIRKIKVE